MRFKSVTKHQRNSIGCKPLSGFWWSSGGLLFN
jgi:hypothetical protein